MPRKGKHSRKRMPDISLTQANPDEPDNNEHLNRSVEVRKAEALEMLSGTRMPSKFKFRDRELARIR